jgi:hypothetical protein
VRYIELTVIVTRLSLSYASGEALAFGFFGNLGLHLGDSSRSGSDAPATFSAGEVFEAFFAVSTFLVESTSRSFK